MKNYRKTIYYNITSIKNMIKILYFYCLYHKER